MSDMFAPKKKKIGAKKPMKSRFKVRQATVVDARLDFEAGNELIRANENANELINIIYDLPPTYLLVLASAFGSTKADSDWWDKVSSKVDGETVPFPSVMTIFMIDRIAKEAKACLNNLMFIPEEIPVEEEDAYIEKVCRLQGNYSHQFSNGQTYIVVDVPKVRAIRASRPLMQQNLLFNVITDTKVETEAKDGFKVKKQAATATCKFAFTPTENDYYSSPILFPEQGVDDYGNLMPTYFRAAYSEIVKSHALNVKDYVLMKLPPLPAVPVPDLNTDESDDESYTDLPPLEKWVAVVDRKPILSAKFCKSVAFEGNVPIEHERVVAAMIGHLAHKDETVGGKLPDVAPWMANIVTPLIWMTTGKIRVNYIAEKIGHSLHLCRDSEQYASSNFLINPVSDREDVNTYGARVFAVSPFDRVVTDKILQVCGARPYQIYLSMGPKPLLWLVAAREKETLPAAVSPSFINQVIPSIPLITERLAFRFFEENMRGRKCLFCYQLIFEVKRNDKGVLKGNLVIIPVAIDMPSVKWTGKEESSKKNAPIQIRELVDFA